MSVLLRAPPIAFRRSGLGVIWCPLHLVHGVAESLFTEYPFGVRAWFRALAAGVWGSAPSSVAAIMPPFLYFPVFGFEGFVEVAMVFCMLCICICPRGVHFRL